MRKSILTLFTLLLVWSCNNKQQTICKVVKSGYITCFDKGTLHPDGKPFTCEPSTVTYFNNNLYIGNDKDFPNGNSPIFAISFKNKMGKKINNLNDSIFFKVAKYESSTLTPDKKFLLLSSSYSYPTNNAKHGVSHNSTIFKSTNHTHIKGFLHFNNNTGCNSFDVKQQIKMALKSDKFPNGPDYLKIEGMTTIPDNQLLFGVREYGKAYRNFDYTITILLANYIQNENGIKLTGTIKKLYTFNPTTKFSKQIKYPLGLSSIEYSQFDKRLYMVTSYEQKENTKGIGAYIWYLSIDELFRNKTPHLIYNSNNQPFAFDHKIEGLTILAKNKLLVIADDDRITGENEYNSKFKKQLNNSYWAELKIEN